MMREFGIQPTIKHYGCMVDLLGGAGYMEEVDLLPLKLIRYFGAASFRQQGLKVM